MIPMISLVEPPSLFSGVTRSCHLRMNRHNMTVKQTKHAQINIAPHIAFLYMNIKIHKAHAGVHIKTIHMFYHKVNKVYT